jgi:hypothetical protein
MCGDGPKAGAKSSTGCSMKCSGNSTEKCGGTDAIGIFKVDCSGPPVPPPPTPPTPAPQPYLKNPCLSAPYAAMPFCNTTLAISARVEDMLGRMTVAEKVRAACS